MWGEEWSRAGREGGREGEKDRTRNERKRCVSSAKSNVCPQQPASFDVANEVSGDILVVDAAGCLVQHNISGGRGLPVGRRLGTKWETK